MKVLNSICQQIWNTQQWPQEWKRSFFISVPKKAMSKNAQTTAQLYSPHMLVFLPGESQGRWSLVGCRLWGRTESDMTEVT